MLTPEGEELFLSHFPKGDIINSTEKLINLIYEGNADLFLLHMTKIINDANVKAGNTPERQRLGAVAIAGFQKICDRLKTAKQGEAILQRIKNL